MALLIMPLKMVVCFESVDEIARCDYSNECLCCYAVHSNTVRVGTILKCDPSSIESWRAALKFLNYTGVNSNE